MTIEEATFVPFPKVPRLNRECIVTEKIDGTNAIIMVSDDGKSLRAGSRTRWITPADDNFGFAAWVESHADELLTLGPGLHFGEWWGSGIQRGYGLTKGEKRFSLFNVTRWAFSRPACCHVVPVVARGLDMTKAANEGLTWLRSNGSVASPGFMRPEGVVVFHSASGRLFKATLERDEEPKGKVST